MSIKIVVSNTVAFKVEGTINDEAGIAQPFNFKVTATRLDSDQIQTKLKTESDASLADFLSGVLQDWAGVLDADSKALPYSEANLRALTRIPGVAALVFQTYLAEVGAKAKN